MSCSVAVSTSQAARWQRWRRCALSGGASSNLVDLLADDDGVVFADLLLAVHAVVERAVVLVAVAVRRAEEPVAAAREAWPVRHTGQTHGTSDIQGSLQIQGRRGYSQNGQVTHIHAHGTPAAVSG